jgi:hypothetical protein
VKKSLHTKSTKEKWIEFFPFITLAYFVFEQILPLYKKQASAMSKKESGNWLAGEPFQKP